MSLAESLERAAVALPEHADAIRPANGDPLQLLAALDAAGAQRVLTWLLGNESEQAAELAAAWLDEPGGADIVAGIPEADLPKPGRKRLRRLHHQLRSRGVAVAAAARAPEPKVARLPSLDESIDRAFVSALDGRGACMLHVLRSHPGGGARIFEAALDEERGVLDFRVYRSGRSQVGELVRELQRGGSLASVEVEPAAGLALLARVAAAHPVRRPLPRPFVEWRGRLFERGVPPAPTPGEQARSALAGAVPTREDLERAAHLAREGDIGPWPPAAERIESAIATIRSQVEAGPTEARESRITAALAAVAEQVYAGPGGATTASRLEESAYVFWRRDREADARACLAAAAAFRESPAAAGVVARALLEVLFAPLLADLRGKRDEAPSPAPEQE